MRGTKSFICIDPPAVGEISPKGKDDGGDDVISSNVTMTSPKPEDTSVAVVAPVVPTSDGNPIVLDRSNNFGISTFNSCNSVGLLASETLFVLKNLIIRNTKY